MQKVNILNIIERLPLGGAESVLYALAQNIDRDKFNLVFCCLDDEGYLAEKLKEDGFEVHCLKEARFRHMWRQMFNLYKLIKKEKIDIVHTHLYKADFWGRLVAVIAGVKVICKSEHTVQHPMAFGVWSELRSRFYNTMKIMGINMFLDSRTDGIVYDTEYARDSFRGKKFDAQKHHVVSGGLVESRFAVSGNKQDIRRKLGFTVDDFVVVIVARLVERKGHRYLMDAFSLLDARHAKMKLLIVGDGPLEKELKARAEQLKVADKIVFTGNVENVQDHIKASDVLVLPSWREALGIVFLEAMFLGVPVIGADEAGIPEIIEDGRTGYLVKVKDSTSIEKAIEKVIIDPEKTRQMVEESKRIVNERFSGKAFARQYEQIYLSFSPTSRAV